MWGLWYKKWHCDVFSSSTSVFPLSVLFHQWSILISILITLLLEDQTRETWEIQIQASFACWVALGECYPFYYWLAFKVCLHILHIHRTRRSRDSSVSIATRYGLEGPGIESRWGEIFRTYPDRLRGPPSLLYNRYRLFPGVKAAGAWCWPLTPF
jgi:hypothetical protein